MRGSAGGSGSAETTGGRRRIAVVGAPSSIGIRPYDGSNEPRRLDLAPAVLRGSGLVERLGSDDLGDVVPPPYRDFVRPPDGVRNEGGLVDYSRALADRVGEALDGDRFALVLGGDCSIVLGALLGARHRYRRVGLAYVDAHADFALPRESYTGSAASMCLGLAVGRGDTALARLGGDAPLVRGEDVALIGRRDEGEPYGHDALAPSGVLDIPGEVLAARGPEAVLALALERLARDGVDGFWIHLDADVLDPRVMPAVDSPEPGGPDVDRLVALLEPLVGHPRALGLQVTIYDPHLDPDRRAGAHLLALLTRVLVARVTAVRA